MGRYPLFADQADEAQARTHWLNMCDEFSVEEHAQFGYGPNPFRPTRADFDADVVREADRYAFLHSLPAFDVLRDVDQAAELLRERGLDGALDVTRVTHTISGRLIGPGNPGPYGRTHDMDCPGCQSTPFTASPRSETYWSS